MHEAGVALAVVLRRAPEQRRRVPGARRACVNRRSVGFARERSQWTITAQCRAYRVLVFADRASGTGWHF
jgi:hypothetical protein